MQGKSRVSARTAGDLWLTKPSRDGVGREGRGRAAQGKVSGREGAGWGEGTDSLGREGREGEEGLLPVFSLIPLAFRVRAKR